MKSVVVLFACVMCELVKNGISDKTRRKQKLRVRKDQQMYLLKTILMVHRMTRFAHEKLQHWQAGPDRELWREPLLPSRQSPVALIPSDIHFLTLTFVCHTQSRIQLWLLQINRQYSMALCCVAYQPTLFEMEPTRPNASRRRYPTMILPHVWIRCLLRWWKTYSAFTIANGQIWVNPQVKNRVCAFIQWCRDEIRLGRNPADSVFPVADAAALIRRYMTHKQWLDCAADKAKNAKPKQFTNGMRWLDWKDLSTSCKLNKEITMCP